VSLKKLTTIRPSADLNQAFDKINKTRLKWLPVVIKDKLVGFLTLKDILKFHPAFFESVREGIQVREETEKRKRISSWSEGICEECENYGLLYSLDGRLICEECKSMQ
jgi:CBS-domain-containing membrane protein